MIQDKQMTINWHADDLTVSHADKDIVDSFVQWTRETYEYITKLKPSICRIHYYLAMILDYTKPAEVKNYMKEYIDRIFEECPYI